MNKIEEGFYEIAAQEVATRSVIRGLMAKAFADASGDERQTVVIYIRLRVEQLMAEHQAELKRQRQERQRQEAAARQRNAPHPDTSDTYICSKCQYHGVFRNESTTNVWALLLLLALGVIPGIIYATSTIRMVCSKCGHTRKR